MSMKTLSLQSRGGVCRVHLHWVCGVAWACPVHPLQLACTKSRNVMVKPLWCILETEIPQGIPLEGFRRCISRFGANRREQEGKVCSGPPLSGYTKDVVWIHPWRQCQITMPQPVIPIQLHWHHSSLGKATKGPLMTRN